MQKNNKEGVEFHFFPAQLEIQPVYLSDGELVWPCLRMKSRPLKERALS